MKRHRYRIYAVNLPADLKERISSIHATALLKAGGKNEILRAELDNKSHGLKQLKSH
jgi:hypothetical protein